MFKIPVANSKTAPPTSRNSDPRSSRCAGERSGGHSNSFGSTDHSLNSRTGTSVTPRVTCTPWLSWYSQTGWVGQENR
jgi:hypothetical protein